MRRSRVFILLAMILLLGAVAAYLLLGGGGPQAQDGEPTPEGGIPSDLVLVAIAAQDIGRGSAIPEDGVIFSRMPANMVVETMISGPDEEGLKARTVGRIARQDIGRGIPITEEMLTEEAGDLLAAGSDASLAIPPGYTAIAIPLDRLSGVAYALRDGDYVDVIISLLMVDVDQDFQTMLPNQSTILVGPGGTEEFPAPSITTGVDDVEYAGEISLQPVIYGKVETDEETGQPVHLIPQETQRPRVVTQRIVALAQVLHVGTFALEEDIQAEIVPSPEEGAGAPAPEPVPGEVGGPQPPDIVTLIVSPQEALVLNWAIKVGAPLTLTLRSPEDPEATRTTSVTLQYLVEEMDVTVPLKLPYSLEPALSELIEPVLGNDEPPAEGN
jgi:Flp pilus assembly protein CpaB